MSAEFAPAESVNFSTTVDKLHPALDTIIPNDPVLERIATGFTWTEGPIWLPSGVLLFADIPGNSILLWNSEFGVRTFMQPSGYTGSEPFGGFEPGSNGMTLDSLGRLTVAGHGRRNVWRLEGNGADAAITVLADSYQGKRLNSPNDLVYRSDGSLYFTDPPYGLPTQKDSDPAKELQINGVYRIPDARRQSPGSPCDPAKLQLLIADLPRPNGLAFSPDERYLYVANSEPEMYWMRYNVKPDGTLGEAKLLFHAGAYAQQGAPDGVKVDRAGNVYSTAPGGIWIFSPDGEHLGILRIPEIVANLHWSSVDPQTLYIAATTSIYRIRLKVPGVFPLIVQ